MTGAEEHGVFEQELAAYLLDALTPEEARRFEAHLASCERCQADARWLRGASDSLLASVEHVEPPPELRERLLDTVRREAGEEAVAARRRPAGARPGRRRLFALRPATALAAASVALAAGIAGYLIGDEGAPEPTTVRAEATAVAPDARASVVHTDDGAVLRVERLPVQRRGRVYQVWLRPKGSTSVRPSTLFVVRPDGRGTAAVPGDLEDVQELLVTLEPEGGSVQPRGRPVLRATLAT